MKRASCDSLTTHNGKSRWCKKEKTNIYGGGHIFLYKIAT